MVIGKTLGSTPSRAAISNNKEQRTNNKRTGNMPQVTINYLAVLIAGVVNMAIGMFWYSPVMFAKTWMASLGKTPEDFKQASAGPIYVLNTVASLVTAYVLAMVIKIAGEGTAVGGAKIAV